MRKIIIFILTITFITEVQSSVLDDSNIVQRQLGLQDNDN